MDGVIGCAGDINRPGGALKPNNENLEDWIMGWDLLRHTLPV